MRRAAAISASRASRSETDVRRGGVPKIDIANLKVEVSTGYPDPFRQVVAGRERKRLGNAVGLDQFGVNLTRLKPGAQSAQRHWHETEDEFVYIVEGELVLS